MWARSIFMGVRSNVKATMTTPAMIPMFSNCSEVSAMYSKRLKLELEYQIKTTVLVSPLQTALDGSLGRRLER